MHYINSTDSDFKGIDDLKQIERYVELNLYCNTIFMILVSFHGS